MPEPFVHPRAHVRAHGAHVRARVGARVAHVSARVRVRACRQRACVCVCVCVCYMCFSHFNSAGRTPILVSAYYLQLRLS